LSQNSEAKVKGKLEDILNFTRDGNLFEENYQDTSTDYQKDVDGIYLFGEGYKLDGYIQYTTEPYSVYD